ncbi:hypothetical protein M513_11672 [Trichuris suis]|uniref:Uncharacterized protein n=1 Tax=Trichuris suis TaxID=68888 RepID=A0A085LR51_9BILA|nr:hypothetical protein M513_11672 [Trichuris suis]
MDISRLARQQNDLTVPVNSLSLCMITRDEHQKEKLRWQYKISELEAQLRRSEETNSQLLQQKAEMNKKVKELEKAQKVLLRSNKKYQEKIHAVVAFETKHFEDKLKQAHEDLAMTKQCLEKISAECCRLKQRKMTADKEEELQRLRNLNVQYCKTIAAYKQLVSDKERKVEVLLRVINRTRKNPSFNWQEFDYQSVSDSVFSLSSQSFDTAPEDQSQLSKSQDGKASCRRLEHTGNARKTNEENGIADQAGTFSSNTSQGSAESGWEEERQKLWTLLKEMRDRINVLQPSREKQQIQIEELLEANELLEFRLLELESCPTVPLCQKCSAHTNDFSSNAPDDYFVPLDTEPLILSDEDLLARFSLMCHKHFLNDDDRFMCSSLLARSGTWKENAQTSAKKISNMERKLVELDAQMECSEITIDTKVQECRALKRTVDELRAQEKELRSQMKDIEDFSKLLTFKLKDTVGKYNYGMNLVSELQKKLNVKERNERILHEKLKWFEIAQQVKGIEAATIVGGTSVEGCKGKMVALLKTVGSENYKLREQLNEACCFNKQLEYQIELRNETICKLKCQLEDEKSPPPFETQHCSQCTQKEFQSLTMSESTENM